ncbi:Uncharacterized protein FWK35_00032486 [Aphis craccivora]|uniref:Uncharacterized protein n=1 Tax=Aphis craccivora TaxID=307492 RepID=A0A6G0VI55_APHCR|nr:Uncharacterized protein FWK35_00032486 [Aphis craccivora]
MININVSITVAKFEKCISYNITDSNYFGQKTSPKKLSSAIPINIGEILNECSTGLMIIDYYKTNHKLNDNIRTLLVDTILNYVITKKISMSDIYFFKYDTNKNPKGKLYAKYYNSMRTLKTSSLIPSSPHTKSSKKPLNRNHDLHFGILVEPENCYVL